MQRQDKTLTVDSGKEFENYAEIENYLDREMYFADVYCALQKAAIKNTYVLLRQYYSKEFCFNKTHNQNKNLL